MKKYIQIIFVLSLISSSLFAQNITGPELLKKTIAFHDPAGEWNTANIRLDLLGEYANGTNVQQKVYFNLPMSTYKIEGTQKEKFIIKGMIGDSCFASIDGSGEYSAEDEKNFRLDCKSIERMRNYYLYLYGLPMKLTDPGTNIADKVEKQTLNDKEYLVLRVQYQPPVGELTWLFFIDPNTYAMEAYQFYKEEKTKAGEVIYLEGLQSVGKMKLPAKRKWYKIPGDEFLGTDIVEGGAVIEE